MTERKDRFKRIDSAIDRIRSEVDDAVDGSKEAGGKAAGEVREALDELEEKVGKLRKKKKAEQSD